MEPGINSNKSLYKARTTGGKTFYFMFMGHNHNRCWYADTGNEM